MIKTSLARALKPSILLLLTVLFLVSIIVPTLFTVTAYAAADEKSFALRPGSSDPEKKAVADAWNEKDKYGDPGWKDIQIFYKGNYIGSPKNLQYNETYTKGMAKKGALGVNDGQPVYNVFYYCSVPDHSITFSAPGGDQEYYQIVYGIVLDDDGNESNGDKFVNSKDFTGYGGVLKTTRFYKPQGVNFLRDEVTHDITTGGVEPKNVDKGDDYNALGGGGKDGDDDADHRFGIAQADQACRPPSAVLGKMSIQNFDRLPEAEKSKFDTNTGSSGSGGGRPGSNTEESCEDNFSSDISWIICPVSNTINTMVNTLDNTINSLLNINTDNVFSFSTESGKAYHSAWSSFRNIALGLIVVAALIVIIASALGFELLDAYTIRKVLPRILIALLFITLSWSILYFLVNLTNDVGNGIRALIYAPFSNFAGEGIKDASGIVALTLIGIGIVPLGIMGLLSFGVTALLAVLIALLVLVVRELIVVFLIITAPIGIALMILPNTQKFWKFWHSTLTNMLLAFPIIAGMIALGRVFSVVTYQANPDNIIQITIAFVAYYLPYFLLPFAFRLAGGIIGTLAGIGNDRSRGAFDRLSNFRKGRSAENWQKTKNFSRFSERTPVGKGINTMMGAAANPKSMLRGRKGVAAARKARSSSYAAGTLKDDQIWNDNQGDDAFLLAVADRELAGTKMSKAIRESQDMTDMSDAGNRKRAEAQREAQKYQHALDLASQMGSTARNRGVQAQALSALAKTGFQFDTGEEGYNQLSTAARKISGGDNGVYSSIMNEAQYGLRTAGRYDLGGINHGAGYNPKAGTDKASLYELANAKPASITELARSAGSTGIANTEQHAIVYKELEAMLPNSKGATRDEILRQMGDMEFRGVKHYMAGATGQTTERRVSYDNTNPAHAGWTSEDQTRGWRIETVNETWGDRAEKKARTYQRPDPNNMP